MVTSLYYIMKKGPRAGVITILDWIDNISVPSRSDWYDQNGWSNYHKFFHKPSNLLAWANHPRLLSEEYLFEIDSELPDSKVIKHISTNVNKGLEEEKQDTLAFSEITISKELIHTGSSITSLKVPIGMDIANNILFLK